MANDLLASILEPEDNIQAEIDYSVFPWGVWYNDGFKRDFSNFGKRYIFQDGRWLTDHEEKHYDTVKAYDHGWCL